MLVINSGDLSGPEELFPKGLHRGLWDTYHFTTNQNLSIRQDGYGGRSCALGKGHLPKIFTQVPPISPKLVACFCFSAFSFGSAGWESS